MVLRFFWIGFPTSIDGVTQV